MPSGGDPSPPPPPPPPAAAASEEEEDDDGEAEDAAQPARTPTPQTQQRFDELCSRLNMDEAARAEAWDSYRSMSESYTLEVSPGRRRGRAGPSGRARRGEGPRLSPGLGVRRRDARGASARPSPDTWPLRRSPCSRRRAPARCPSLWGAEWATPLALKQHRAAEVAMQSDSCPGGRVDRCTCQNGAEREGTASAAGLTLPGPWPPPPGPPPLARVAFVPTLHPCESRR